MSSEAEIGKRLAVCLSDVPQQPDITSPPPWAPSTLVESGLVKLSHVESISLSIARVDAGPSRNAPQPPSTPPPLWPKMGDDKNIGGSMNKWLVPRVGLGCHSVSRMAATPGQVVGG
jgi:hypothetical protein